MGRPRLYHTPEQKKQARQETLIRYYDKHRMQLCRRARRRYKKARKSLKQGLDEPSIGGAITTSDPLEAESENPLKVITTTQEQFEELTKGSVSDYLSDLVEQCLNDIDGTKDYCQEVSRMWDTFLHDVQDILSSILQEYGCGPEYDVTNGVCSNVRRVIGLLTEVEEHLISSPNQLGAWYALRRLSYQNCD